MQIKSTQILTFSRVLHSYFTIICTTLALLRLQDVKVDLLLISIAITTESTHYTLLQIGFVAKAKLCISNLAYDENKRCNGLNPTFGENSTSYN